jgi:hypothetical protein
MSFVPNFMPSQRAPLFGNGPWPAGAPFQFTVPGLPTANIDARGMGLCGGMSFLTRDIFESGTPQLRGRSSSEIPLVTAQHILGRLINSFEGPGVVPRWLQKTAEFDHGTVFGGPGLYAETVNEVPGIRSTIDAGRLCPIGVITLRSAAPWDVFQNHVVLVFGYEIVGHRCRLHVYDCNLPGRDDITIELDIADTKPAKPIDTNGSVFVRGFFQLPYTHADPASAYVDDAVVTIASSPPVRMAPGDSAHVTVLARNSGSTTWTVADGYKLGTQAPQDNSTWGPNRQALTGPVDPGSSAAFHFDVLAPATPGTYGACWQMLREGRAWFGSKPGTEEVSVGALTGTVCDALHAKHASLVTQLAQLHASAGWVTPAQALQVIVSIQTVQAQLAGVESQQHAAGCAVG